MSNKLYGGVCTALNGLVLLESKYRSPLLGGEYLPFAKNTSLSELSEIVKPDPDGEWAHPIYISYTRHDPSIGITELCKRAHEYIDSYSRRIGYLDILSICAGLQGDKISLSISVRFYSQATPDFSGIYSYVDSFIPHTEETIEKLTLYDEEDDATDALSEESILIQQKAFNSYPLDVPVLNHIGTYKREFPPVEEKIYDLRKKAMKIRTLLPYDQFIDVFRSCMDYIATVERDSYFAAIKDPATKPQFWSLVDAFIKRNILSYNLMSIEDYPALKNKLERALFDLYIIQDLIDDPAITDIKITAYDSVRVRIKGKAYLSNVSFLDEKDYLRFITSLSVRNNIDLSLPTQTFTDSKDDGYVLRFTLTSSYITSSGTPVIHIRKISRKKMLGTDLINAGMFDENVMNYLLDCGRKSRGVVFAGAPGSGKTICLNWFLEEAYEPSAEILCIQESDELFSDRKGIMFEHVVSNPSPGQQECSLEDLGKRALVAGVGVLVIGETKGAEICSAITLSNSGCRTAMTIHSPSSEETLDKMVDLALRGYATSYEQAKRMLKSFQTIVYLEDFKVKEITEVLGYDETAKDMIYRKIYSRGA